MDAKANALRRLKLKSPMKGLPTESVASEKKDDDDLGDKAPSLKPHVSSELSDEHMPLMKSLSDGVSHPGRGPKSLDERAAGSMKEIMASKMKHKKV